MINIMSASNDQVLGSYKWEQPVCSRKKNLAFYNNLKKPTGLILYFSVKHAK